MPDDDRIEIVRLEEQVKALIASQMRFEANTEKELKDLKNKLWWGLTGLIGAGGSILIDVFSKGL